MKPLFLGLILISMVSPTLAASIECDSLSELDCLKSMDCVLDQEPETKNYFCRNPVDDCEKGFSQYDPKKKACESKSNCQFIPGKCYCPPDVLCVCGGGSPPFCRVKK